MKTKAFLSCLLLSLTVALIACASTPRYVSDRSVADLCEVALDALDGDGLVYDTVGITDDYFTLPDYVTEHAVLYCPDTDCIDELGIFRVESGKAKELAELLKTEYLAASYEKNRDFYESYLPKEAPKLRDARVECYGDTVVYTVLSPTDEGTVHSALRRALAMR